MRARISVAGLALLATGLAAPTYARGDAAVPAGGIAAAAGGETCQGKAATIVDHDGGTVQGTDGDDVIVTAPDVTVLAGPGRDAVCVAGTANADYVDVRDGEDLTLTLRGGYDTLHISRGSAGGGEIDAGAGGAYLEIVPDRSLFLDLLHSYLSMDADSTYSIVGDWDVTAAAKRVRLIGDSGPNHLRALNHSCHIRIEGRRGKDWLAVAPNTVDAPDFPCSNPTAPQLVGQRGNDLLVGWKRDDRLVGGRGQDTAKGGFGRDFCRAEIRKSCER